MPAPAKAASIAGSVEGGAPLPSKAISSSLLEYSQACVYQSAAACEGPRGSGDPQDNVEAVGPPDNGAATAVAWSVPTRLAIISFGTASKDSQALKISTAMGAGGRILGGRCHLKGQTIIPRDRRFLGLIGCYLGHMPLLLRW
jgi:hypothetical protein